jgi:ribonuclease HI
VELGALTLDFKPRTTIKSQALVDFMAKWRENQVEVLTNQPEHWVMYFDGSLKLGGGGAGVLFISPRGEQLKYVFQILFEVSNNEAEYEAFLHGLYLAISLGVKRLHIYGDSLLVVQQVNKEWDINKDTMDDYIQEIHKLEKKFLGLEIHHVVHDNNVAVDVLSKLDSDRANVPPGVFIHELHHPSIRALDSSSVAQGLKELDQEVLMIKVDWRVAFIDYIQEHKLPHGVDPKSAAATRILRRSKGYVLIGGNLYKRGSASGILMKCVRTEEGKEILQDIHEGVCGNHAASNTLVSKAFRSSFYWPTALADAEALICRCTNCQFFGKQRHVPAYNLITIPPSWPFACWGLDMIGPFTTTPGGFTHVLVAIDKFTKWIEYKPITTLSADRVVTFICDILHHFSFPNTIITYLGSNFHSHQF